MRRSLGFLLALAASPLAAQPGPAPEDAWHAARSDHFEVLGDVDPDALDRAAADLERLRRVIAELGGSGALSSRPTRVYLFSSESAFDPYRLPGSSSSEAGYVVPGEAMDFAATASPRITSQVYRQYVMEMLHRQLPDVPAWLRVGFAEYYSTFEADAGEARIGLPDEARLNWIGLTGGAELPLPDLLTADEAPVTGEPLTDSLFPTQSWLLVHYLMSGDETHRRRIVDYVRRIRAGEDALAAFRSAFGVGDLEGFGETLSEYRRGDSFTFLRVPLGREDAEGEIRTAPLSEAETALAQGELLLRLGPGRRSAAEERLRRAAELDGTLGAAWAGLARLAEARRQAGEDDAGAVRLWERAAREMPDDFAVQLGLGQAKLGALDGRRASDEASRAALAEAAAAFRRATELRPESGEAWAGLGQAGVLAAEPDPEAPAALEKAVELLPRERSDVLFNLLLARARIGDAAGVDEAALSLREAGAEADLLARAREVRLQLTLQEAHALATAGELDDAVALLAVVRAESTNPAVAEQAAQLLQRVSRADEHNRFAESYTEAVERFRAGDLDAARETVEAMMATATPGRQMDTLRQLRARIELAAQGEQEGE